MFIVLEGLHGVGKSTVACKLANDINADLVPTVGEPFNRVRRAVDQGSSLEWRHAVYAVAVLDAAGRIAEMLATGRTVVAESWLYRTMAFHRGMGSELALPMTGVDIPLPDKGFLLTCDECERQRRLGERSRSRSSAPIRRRRRCAKWRSLAESKRKQIEDEYRRFDLERVDATPCVEQVVGLLRDRIKS